jgi:DNA-binding beta-propeller fold protein YncE
MARLLALAGVALVLLGSSPASGKVGDLYALRYGAKMSLLVPYDPVRLVPSGRAIRIGHFAHAWSISPDRSLFVAAAGWRLTKGGPAALRFVDLASGRLDGTVSLPGELGRVTATAWVGGRVLVVVSESGSTRVYAIDPKRRVVTSQVEFEGVVVLGERTPSKLVLLLAPADRIGSATIAVVDRSSRVRTALLDRIAAGTTATGVGENHRVTVNRPALALSPSGLRAFVVGAGDSAASVDLRTLAVRYAPMRRTAVATKQVEGSVRTAAALPDGRLVVTGVDYGARHAVGLWLVDPKDWSRRLLDPAANFFRVAGGHVFVPGRKTGLSIVRPSGELVELLHSGSVSSVSVIGPRAFVTFFGTNQQAAVIDLGTDRVVRHTVPAHLLVEPGEPIIG